MRYANLLREKLLDQQERFTIPNTVRIMEDLLAGLKFSHDRGVVHRDIKPANVMLTSEGQAKIADFGTATLIGAARAREGGTGLMAADSVATMTTGLGTPLWMAPEMLAGERYSRRIDVYSYGVVMWEIAAQALPWADLRAGAFFMGELLCLLRDGVRPVVDSGWPCAYMALMARCWATDPDMRPEFDAIVADLQAMQRPA